MKCNKVFSTIDKLNDQYIRIWEDVCNLESPTNYKEGVDAVGNYFAALAQKIGWQVEFFAQPVAGNVVCITMNPNVGERPLCLSGHIDTVHPVGSFGMPAVKLEGENICGPGVTDCKGGVVAGFLAMDALFRCGFDKRPIRLLLQTDEECGSIISNMETIGYICEQAKDAIAFLNLEGHTEGEVCLVRKGIVTFTFLVRGIEAHSSKCAAEGASAIAEAAHKLLELEKIKDAQGLTCNCGVIKGGTVVNTVPGFCEFKANVRFANKEQLNWIRNYVQELAANNQIEGCSCEVLESGFRAAMEYNEQNAALADAMNSIFEANGLPFLKPSKRTGGSDAAIVSACGIPCVDSIGVTGFNIHTQYEYAKLASLAYSAKRIAAVAIELEEKDVFVKAEA